MFVERSLNSWKEIADAFDFLAGRAWVFRGQSSANWVLQTSLEREFGRRGQAFEQNMFWRFVRLAPRFLPGHLTPPDMDAAAWLGLIQHYGGPTRLLDVTRAPYVALFFAFEADASEDRAVWAINVPWCVQTCARLMARNEGASEDEMVKRAVGAQAQLVYSLIHRQPYRDPMFASFKEFRGVFPLDPWKPDPRQSAQQALFLCAADPSVPFMDNLAAHDTPKEPAIYRLRIPGALREEVLDRLGSASVNAGTLFPDPGGLARSLRTLPIQRPPSAAARPPWGGS